MALFSNNPELPNNTPKSTDTTTSQLGLFTQIVQNEINKGVEINFSAKLITDTTDFENLCKDLNNQSFIAINIKYDFTNAVENSIIGISFAYENEINYENLELNNNKNEIKTFYIPLKHDVLENKLNNKYVFDKLKPILESERIKKTVFNLKDTYSILKNIGIDFKGAVFDIELASYISNPSLKHDLYIQSLEFINHSIAQYAEPEDIKRLKLSLTNANIDCINKAVCDESFSIYKLTAYWKRNLQEKELNILQNLELPIAKVLSDMEYSGVTINSKYLQELSNIMNGKLTKLENEIYSIADCKFNINSPKQVSEILFDKLGLKTNKKKKSTSAEVLEELAEEHKIAKFILEYRKYAKLKSTYTDALPDLISKIDNRIHASFNQTITATGRLSSSNPNLQNIPARTEEGSKIRAAFIPEDRENSLILSADYSQIELRLLAHISQDKHLIEAFSNDIDVHTLTASKVFGVPIENVTKDMRYKSKAVNFGIIYGQSKYGLAKAIGISNNEAEDFINRYFETYPSIKLYMNATIEFAEKNGYVETIFGRRRYLPEIKSSNIMIREFAKRAAINQPIQGTAADLMKYAMFECYKRIKEANLNSKIILQVHDEIVIEAQKTELEILKKLVKESMELNQPLKVPLKIDINTGETWKEQ